jgi:hypothetical protein
LYLKKKGIVNGIIEGDFGKSSRNITDFALFDRQGAIARLKQVFSFFPQERKTIFLPRRANGNEIAQKSPDFFLFGHQFITEEFLVICPD